MLQAPILRWIKTYHKEAFLRDLVAAMIVTMLLIPQSLAYAMLAGLPPEVGLYASILPLVFYAFFGSSTTLSVGPVAVISLMTATSLGAVAEQGGVTYLTGAITLALMSGTMYVLLGVFRFGFVANFLSHTVISGFITASGIIIALGQVKHLLGVDASGGTLLELLPPLFSHLEQTNLHTLVLGVSVLCFLFLTRTYLAGWLLSLGAEGRTAELIAKTSPVIAVVGSIFVAKIFVLKDSGVALTGAVPSGFPAFQFALPDVALIEALFLPALMITLIGYIESISVGKTLGAKRQEKVDPDQELVGLGMANIASGVSGGFPVTGGFSRSVVNFDAGAVTQVASILAGLGILMACLFLTPILFYLPKATLAATIIVAVSSLIDFGMLKRTWAYSKSDFYAVCGTIIITLTLGVEIGVASGIFLSISLHLYRTSKPHIAEVGLVAGTEHFRNVERFKVETSSRVLTLRQDESLFFANAAQLEDRILNEVYRRDSIAHVIIQFSAVNEVDFSALEMLESLNSKLLAQGICLHFSEVKGPVMDKLKQTGLFEDLSGNVYLSQYEAFQSLK